MSLIVQSCLQFQACLRPRAQVSDTPRVSKARFTRQLCCQRRAKENMVNFGGWSSISSRPCSCPTSPRVTKQLTKSKERQAQGALGSRSTHSQLWHNSRLTANEPPYACPGCEKHTAQATVLLQQNSTWEILGAPSPDPPSAPDNYIKV